MTEPSDSSLPSKKDTASGEHSKHPSQSLFFGLSVLTFSKKAGEVYQRFDQSHYALWLWSLVFFAGFALNSFAAHRIDDWKSTTVLAVFACIGGIAVFISALYEHHVITAERWLKRKATIQFTAQFCLGGLFSKNVEFYFQSASLTKSILFMICLAGAAYLTEVFKRRISRSAFHFPLYFLALFSFLTFFIPILSGVMTRSQFLWAGGLALMVVIVMLLGLWRSVRQSQTALTPRYLLISGTILGIFAAKSALYTFNLIPPVPIALRTHVICHTVVKEDGDYRLAFQPNPVEWQFWRKYDPVFRYQSGDTLFCFTSIFAPTALKKRVYHEWRYWDDARGWVRSDSIPYTITGGRDTGFRGYTYKRAYTSGRWQVDVLTEDGFILGRAEIEVLPGKTTRSPELIWVKQ